MAAGGCGNGVLALSGGVVLTESYLWRLCASDHDSFWDDSARKSGEKDKRDEVAGPSCKKRCTRSLSESPSEIPNCSNHDEDGWIYTGEVNNEGLRHGIGTLTREDSVVEYQGNWVNGQFIGMGVMSQKEGPQENWKKIVGIWESIDHVSLGNYLVGGEIQFIGEIRSQIYEGLGVFFLGDGGSIVGSFENGSIQEEGIIRYSNGDHYVGQFIHSKFQGIPKGIGGYVTAQGAFCMGLFGNTVEGATIQSVLETGCSIDQRKVVTLKSRTSEEITEFPLGLHLYKGPTKDGKREGQGIVFLPDRSVLFGSFKADKVNGLAVSLSGDKTMSLGAWSGDKRVEKTISYVFDQKRFEIGCFENGARHGKFFAIQNQTYEVSYWKNGVQHGVCYQINHSVCIKKHFENGLLHGSLEVENEKERITATFSQGKQTREELHFKGSGCLRSLFNDMGARSQSVYTPQANCPVPFYMNIDWDERKFLLGAADGENVIVGTTRNAIIVDWEQKKLI